MPFRYSAAASYCWPDMLGAVLPPPPPGALARRADEAPSAPVASNRHIMRCGFMTPSSPGERRKPHPIRESGKAESSRSKGGAPAAGAGDGFEQRRGIGLAHGQGVPPDDRVKPTPPAERVEEGEGQHL